MQVTQQAVEGDQTLASYLEKALPFLKLTTSIAYYKKFIFSILILVVLSLENPSCGWNRRRIGLPRFSTMLNMVYGNWHKNSQEGSCIFKLPEYLRPKLEYKIGSDAHEIVTRSSNCC